MAFSVSILYTGIKKKPLTVLHVTTWHADVTCMCIEGFSTSDHAVRDVTGLYVRASSIQNSLSLL